MKAVVGAQRGVPDISMSAACNGGVDTYQSFAGQTVGWYPVCGTSEATPLFAGVVALADQDAGHPLGLINPALYSLSAGGAPGIVDMTTGDNTVSFPQNGSEHTVTGFSAQPGYDLASGSAPSTPPCSSPSWPRPLTDRPAHDSRGNSFPAIQWTHSRASAGEISALGSKGAGGTDIPLSLA